MAQLRHHPAPGIGPMLPHWTTPPRRMEGPSTPLVATPQAAYGGRAMWTRSIGDLVNASFPVPQNPIISALVGGVGDLTDSYFPVPMNPILAAAKAGMGDLTAGNFPVPQNPIIAGAGMSGLGCSSCSGGWNGYGMQGLGDFISAPMATWIQADSPIPGVSNISFWGGLVLAGLAYLEFGRKHRR